MVLNDHNMRDLSILIIDDDPLVQKTIGRILHTANSQYFVQSAATVEEALACVRSTYWDTILLDMSLPVKKGGSSEIENGLYVLDCLNRELKITAPIIAITGHGDDELAEIALDKGAYYFLTKPVKAKSLAAIVNNATKFQLAGFDGLTGLLNRITFEERLKSEFERTKRKNECNGGPQTASYLSLIFLDGDNFKKINDTYNHMVGDQVLKMISNSFIDDRLYQVFNNNQARCRYIFRPYDIASRFGGDEFSIFLPETDHSNALMVAKRIKDVLNSLNLSSLIRTGENIPADLSISLSIGIATYPDPNSVACHEDLLKFADEAMYASKESRSGDIFGYNLRGELLKLE